MAAGDPTGLLLDVDTELYRAVNPADRPGDNDYDGYDGYDIASFALELASRWDTELVCRARAAVDPLTAACRSATGWGSGRRA